MSVSIRLLMRAASPITHGAGTSGNEQIIKREPVNTPLGIRLVPTISGNSMRHRMVREPLAKFLISEWGLAGKLTKEQVRFLFNGGALGSDHGSSLSRIAEVDRLIPMFALLGGSLPDTIVRGRVQFGMAWLVCEETLSLIECDTPPEWWPIIAPEFEGQPVRQFAACNAEHFVGRGQYYRHDAARSKPYLIEGGEIPEDVAMMPHAGEIVVSGSEFYCRLNIDRPSDRDLGALLFALSEWQDSGATLGGQAARGHGRFHASIDLGDIDADSVDGLIESFKSHVRESKDDGIAFLSALYGKGAKSKGGAA